MSNVIQLNTQTLMDYARKFQSLAGRLYQVQQNLSALYNSTHIPGLSMVANRRTVSECGNKLLEYSQWCLDVFQDFQIVERDLIQRDVETFVRPKNLAIDEYTGNSSSSMVREGVDEVGGIIGKVGKISDEDSLKDMSGNLAYLSLLAKIWSGEGTTEEDITDFIELMSKSPDMLEQVYKKELKKLEGWNEDLSKINPNSEAGKFISKYGKAMDWLGFGGQVLGTGGTLVDTAWGKDVSDYLLHADKVIKDGMGYKGLLMKIAEKYPNKFPKWITGVPTTEIGKKNLNHNLNAVGALFSMATTATGDVMQASKDGSYTIDEYGNICLKTGLSGASSLASAYTFGIINIDTDKAYDTFQDNITVAQDWIKTRTDNKAVQVALVVPATVVVSAVSAVEVAVDTVADTVNKVQDAVGVVANGVESITNTIFGTNMYYNRIVSEQALTWRNVR